jgi:hypothetical protein
MMSAKHGEQKPSSVDLLSGNLETPRRRAGKGLSNTFLDIRTTVPSSSGTDTPGSPWKS